MIQEISPKVFYNQFSKECPKADDLIFIFKEGKALLYIDNGTLKIPTYQQIKEIFPKSIENIVYLFAVDKEKAFIITDSRKIEGESGVNLEDLKEFTLEKANKFNDLDKPWQRLMGMTAAHLSSWYRQNKFCGVCSNLMRHSEKERSMECKGCGNIVYPTIAPVVIVGVKDGERILLTRYANREYKKYALIAGFCEIGETVEQCIEREVYEEAGVRVKNIKYYKSQPWGYSGSLLMGFFADLDGCGEIVLDKEELAEGVWLSREEIPIEGEDNISLTREMMISFKNGII